MSDAEGWERVAALDALPTGTVQQVAVGGEPVAIYNIAGTICATSDICTHAHAFLSEGYLEGDVIECPLHQGTFRVPTGEALGGPVTEDLATYRVRVTDGEVFVSLT